MKLSVIIPTYNMASMLRAGLSYLAVQEPVPGGEYELIVIDDGSTDGTRGVVEEFTGRLPRLSYHFLPRGPASCRAAARNRGIEVARGELLVFLDSGIALPRHFLRTVAERLEPASRRVLLHPVAGIVAGYGTLYGSSTSALERLSPESFEATLEQLRLWPDWEDPREGFFALCAEQLERLPAPWTLGWTTALSLPRALTMEVGGYDAGFLGWGMEDVEFSYRLHLKGARFVVARDAAVMHLPHPPLSSSSEKQRSNEGNARLMHRKHRTRETELCQHFPGPHLNPVLSRLDMLIIQGRGLRYAPELLQALASSHLGGAGPSLAVGVDGLAEAQHLPVTHMLAHHHALRDRLAARFPTRTVQCLLGVDTLWPERFFEVAVVTDFLRMHSEAMARRMVREVLRVSRRALLLCTPAATPDLTSDGQPWASMQALNAMLREEGVRPVERLVRGQQALFELERAA